MTLAYAGMHNPRVAKRRHKPTKGRVLEAPSSAVRHTFSAGLLGHDLNASPWLVNVSELSLLGVDAAFACVRVTADAVAGADVGEWDGPERILPASPLVRRPDPDVPQWEFIWQAVSTLMLYQAMWVQSADIGGTTIALRVIAPSRVTETAGELLVDAKPVRRESMRYWRRSVYPTVSGQDASIILLAREVLAAEMAASAYRSDFWQQGGAPVTILTTDQTLPEGMPATISDAWVERRTTSPGKPAVLSRGVKAQSFGADLGTGGANDAGDKLKASVARYLGVPPSLINVTSEGGSMQYTTAEQEFLRFRRLTVQPYCDVIGGMLSEYLPGDPSLGRRVIINPSKISQPGALEWAQALVTASGGAYITREEARVEDGRQEAPLVGGFVEVTPNVGP